MSQNFKTIGAKLKELERFGALPIQKFLSRF